MAESNSTSIGRTFSIIAWLLLMAMLYFFFEDQIDQQLNPNRDINSYSTHSTNVVTLNADRYGHFITPGTINQQPVIFMLDTGATHVAIPEKIANNLGLIKGQSYRVNTANGQTLGYATEIARLQIGNITLNNVKASITKGFEGEQILLGMSALKQLEFTHANKQLILKQYH
ncbi:retropepsin-like aspartic protease family protein [Flocculibacter collagenilyticus]|uniref:retropepsin-like aspartic protease family protein n=1 Tax=Flocculibacter collagenilyticus TaxID=2744479 RepID=UPI0018F38947|nr:TIGR02281 family clan AA aspartic protease [Flocculibacter collagenilyticus]